MEVEDIDISDEVVGQLLELSQELDENMMEVEEVACEDYGGFEETVGGSTSGDVQEEGSGWASAVVEKKRTRSSGKGDKGGKVKSAERAAEREERKEARRLAAEARRQEREAKTAEKKEKQKQRREAREAAAIAKERESLARACIREVREAALPLDQLLKQLPRKRRTGPTVGSVPSAPTATSTASASTSSSSSTQGGTPSDFPPSPLTPLPREGEGRVRSTQPLDTGCTSGSTAREEGRGEAPTVEDTPVPTQDTAVPTQDTAVPTQEDKPVPTQEDKPAPTQEDKPAPTQEDKPVPTQEDRSASSHRAALLSEQAVGVSQGSGDQQPPPSRASPPPMLSEVEGMLDSLTAVETRLREGLIRRRSMVTPSGGGDEPTTGSQYQPCLKTSNARSKQLAKQISAANASQPESDEDDEDESSGEEDSSSEVEILGVTVPDTTDRPPEAMDDAEDEESEEGDGESRASESDGEDQQELARRHELAKLRQVVRRSSSVVFAVEQPQEVQELLERSQSFSLMSGKGTSGSSLSGGASPIEADNTNCAFPGLSPLQFAAPAGSSPLLMSETSTGSIGRRSFMRRRKGMADDEADSSAFLAMKRQNSFAHTSTVQVLYSETSNSSSQPPPLSQPAPRTAAPTSKAMSILSSNTTPVEPPSKRRKRAA